MNTAKLIHLVIIFIIAVALKSLFEIEESLQSILTFWLVIDLFLNQKEN